MDFLGGILDDIRGVGDDIFGFFDSSIGKAVGRGLLNINKQSEEARAAAKNFDLRKDFDNGYYTEFRSKDRGQDLRSEDFYSTERQWLQRLQHFSGVVKETKV